VPSSAPSPPAKQWNWIRNPLKRTNSLAFASFWGYLDAATADREFKRALELDPSFTRAHIW
jgi:hypothetical protein